MPDIHLHKEDLKASLPAFLTAFAYGVVLFGLDWVPGITGEDLTLLLQVEFLVIHSFPFLAIFSWAGRPEGKDPALLKTMGNPKAWRAAFWGFLCMYVLVALSMGWKGPFYFFAATAATYPLFLGLRAGSQEVPCLPGLTTTVKMPILQFSPVDRESWARLGSAWLACFILYLAFTGFFDLSNNVDEWDAEWITYQAGFWYFLSLGVLEMMGVHGKLAKWAKVMYEKSQPPKAG
jgi:hypothetical protein